MTRIWIKRLEQLVALLTKGYLVIWVFTSQAIAQVNTEEGDSLLASLVILFVILPLSLGILSAYYFLGKSASGFLGKLNFFLANAIIFIYFKWLGGPSSFMSTLLLILPIMQLLLFFLSYPNAFVFKLGNLNLKHKTAASTLLVLHILLGNYFYRDYYLYQSCRYGLANPAKFLLSINARPQTPGYLYTAAYNGHTHVAKILIDAGADSRELHGISLEVYKFLADVRALDWQQAKRYLDNGGSVDAQNHNGETALLALAGITSPAKAEIEMSQALLALGANPNIFDVHKDVPLIRAVEAGNAPLVALLLKHGADIEHRGPGFGNLTAFDRVVQKNRGRPGDAEIFKAFLKAGASAHGTDKNGYTVLMRAVEAKNLEFAKILIAKGVPVNVVEPAHGLSALFMIVSNLGSPHRADIPLLRLLLNNGVDVNLRDRKGRSARELYKKLGREDLVMVLDAFVNATP